MIRFQCPNCHKVLKAPDHGAGRKTSCPRCGQRLLVPPPVQAQARNKTTLGKPVAPVPEWVGDVAAAKAQSTRTPSPAAKPGCTIPCPGCNAPVLIAEEEQGRMVQCPKCQTTFAAVSEEMSSGASQSAESTLGTANSARHQEDDLEPLVYRRDIRKGDDAGSMMLGILVHSGGGFLAVVGLLMLAYFWLIYDTSVPVDYPVSIWSPRVERVHNVGLMQNRLVGIIIGGGAFVVGIALYLVGYFILPVDVRKWLILCSFLVVCALVIMLFIVRSISVFLH